VKLALFLVVSLAVGATGVAEARQQGSSTPTKPAQPAQKPNPVPPPAKPSDQTLPKGVTPPPDYVIGVGDILTVIVWREKDLSADAMVRPDGMVTLPLVNDVRAAGLTPDVFRQQVTEAAERYVTEPSVTVIVKEIHSRRVHILGEIPKPGPYSLGGPTTVLQLIAEAGGLSEYADAKNILVIRNADGQVSQFRFNYRDVQKGRRLEQNILLKPGDTVVVP
jgi:polysaccharide export outer membrane protein